MATGSRAERLVVSSLSDVGRVHSTNRDAHGEFESGAGERLIVLADGGAGQHEGEISSRVSVECIARAFLAGEGLPDERLRQGFLAANNAVRKEAAQRSGVEGMAATAAAMIVEPDGTAWIAWVGDSRVYRSSEGRLELLTRDHAVVAEWLRLGVITPEEAETHPRRDELLRAIGGTEQIEVEVRRAEVEVGDRFLLCTDGLTAVVDDERIGQLIGAEVPVHEVSMALVRAANQAGGTENVTVQVMESPAGPLPLGMSFEVPRAPRRPVGSSAWIGALAAFLLIAVGVGGYFGLGTRLADFAATPATSDQDRKRIVEVRNIREGQARQQRREQAKAPAVSPEPAPVAEPALEVAKPAPIAEPEVERAPVVAPEPVAEEIAEIVTESIPEPAAAPIVEPEAVVAVLETAPEPEPVPAPVPVAAESAVVAEAETQSIGEPMIAAVEPVRAAPLPDVAAAPPVLPVELTEADVRGFLADWALAVRQGDYALYNSLGFADTPAEFRRSYRRPSVDVEFEILEHTPGDGDHRVRILEKISYRKGGEQMQDRIERALVLRAGADGVRYAGEGG